ncbi:4Fe-4S binding domain protein, partial [Vibrio parahaemolyticus V-223/04]
RITYSS